MLPALAKLTSGALTVDAVPVLHIADIGGLGVYASMTVSGTADAIAGDLILDGGSQLAAYHTQITGVTVSDSNPIMLTDTQALDAEQTALALLPPGSLQVTDAMVSEIVGVAAIGAPLASMAVSDTYGAITTDLEKGTGQLRAGAVRQQDWQRDRDRRHGGAERQRCLGGDRGAGEAGCRQPDDRQCTAFACRHL